MNYEREHLKRQALMSVQTCCQTADKILDEVANVNDDKTKDSFIDLAEQNLKMAQESMNILRKLFREDLQIMTGGKQ